MSMLRLDDKLLGRFRIDARIAEGGMGIVYRGFDLEIDQPIAIKILQPEAIDSVARFEREATLLATLAHPGVVRYVAHGVAQEGLPFLVTEWIDGTTLAEHHARIGLTPAEGVAVVRRVAEALGTAHAHGLVHRDIKPDNILLAGGDLERPKLIDFGLVRRRGDHRLTETGVVVGTPGYMAPEQARGEREIDARSDVFGLGCVLYECITGEPAFAGRNAAAVMARIVLCDAPALRDAWPSVPPQLDSIVTRMLARRPDARQRDASVVASELAAIITPEAPRRRRASADADTTVVSHATDETAAHVIFVQASAVAGDLASIIAPFDAQAQQLLDGTIVIVLGDDVALAADCALALARSYTQAPIVLTGPGEEAGTAPLAQLLDTGAGELEQADLQQIFGKASLPGSIRVDPATAARLARQFDVREDHGVLYLIGRSSP